MRSSWALALLLVSTLAASLEAAEEPRFELDAERRWVLTDLPPILADDGVQEHLTTGLTTSFYLRPGKQPGGARVDVRYDPWDEVFHVIAAGSAGGDPTQHGAGGDPTQHGAGGDPTRHGGESLLRAELASFAELVEWWQGLRLALVEGDRLDKPWPRRLKVSVDVIPFSAREQDDARRWLSESIEQGRKSGTGDVGSGDSADTLSRTFNLLLATSIRRRALATYVWSPSSPPEESP